MAKRKGKSSNDSILIALFTGVISLIINIVRLVFTLFHEPKAKSQQFNDELPSTLKASINNSIQMSESSADESNGGHEPYEYMEPLNSDKTVQGSISEHLRISYKDATGRETVRNVDVTEFVSDGSGGMINGYCHLRKERRSFYLPRILSTTNLETGELLSNLAEWLIDEYLKTPDGQAKIFINEHEDELRVVFYVAKADNLFKPKDQGKMRDFIYALGADTALGLVVFEHIKKYWSQEWIVEHNKRLRRLAVLDQLHKNKIIKAMEEIVGGSKQAHTAEIKALANAKKLLNIG